MNEPTQVTPARITIEMWTDGACSCNPGAGGWAAVLKTDAPSLYVKELYGRASDTTNNLMELAAVAGGLRAIRKPANIKIHTDSRQVIGWMRDGWRRKDSDCAELSSEIDKLISDGQHVVEWIEVKGHSGDEMNERCDKLASREAQAQRVENMKNAAVSKTYSSEPTTMELPY
jgi:ribonuclease HI